MSIHPNGRLDYPFLTAAKNEKAISQGGGAVFWSNKAILDISPPSSIRRRWEKSFHIFSCWSLNQKWVRNVVAELTKSSFLATLWERWKPLLTPNLNRNLRDHRMGIFQPKKFCTCLRSIIDWTTFHKVATICRPIQIRLRNFHLQSKWQYPKTKGPSVPQTFRRQIIIWLVKT